MSYAPQSSPGLRLLPACLLLAALAAGPVAAQDQRHLSDSTDLHRDPEGAPLVSLPAGAAIETGAAKGGEEVGDCLPRRRADLPRRQRCGR